MRIQERYRRLTVWNKLSVWAGVASILSFFVAIIFWLFPRSPSNIIAIDKAFEEDERRGQIIEGEASTTHTFWLLHEPGAKISLGHCPGEKCIQFELGKLRLEGGLLWQQIFLDGEGVGIKHDPKQKFSGIDSLMRLKGATLGLLDLGKDKRWFTEISLKRESSFDIFADIAHIKLWVLDTRSDSLKIKLEIWPPKNIE
jgi:hypothetical protein